jgi:hypothetical protein
MDAQHDPGQDASGLLQAWGRGHVEARDQLVGHTLQPTALVHEAYLRLVTQDRMA